jgi:hypothetical protein
MKGLPPLASTVVLVRGGSISSDELADNPLGMAAKSNLSRGAILHLGGLDVDLV